MCNCSSLARTSFIQDGRAFGTWDFKWPQGSRIDVHFQALPEDQLAALRGMGFAPPHFHLSDAERKLIDEGKNEFGRLTRVVECLAQRWLRANEAKLEFVFTHDQPLPIAPADNDPLQDYDVLVSLANLPLARRLPQQGRPLTQEDVEVKGIFLPGSELGRYCQRVDYRIPTTYLGMRRFFEGTQSNYFKSQEFWHWCVHEFGHVMGLPHEHQNPKVHAKILESLKCPEDIQKVLALALGDTEKKKPNPRITLGEIEEEITTAWPVQRDQSGAFLYSDLRDYKVGEVPDDSSSIMFHIYWQRLLLNSKGDEPARFLENPTEGDRAHISNMYR